MALFAACPALLAGCGAGLVSGVVASNGGNNSPAPTLNPVETRLPLVPGTGPSGAPRSVVIANSQLSASAHVRVLIRADIGGMVTAEQGRPTIAGQGSSTVVGFDLDTAPFLDRIGDPTQRGVSGQLVVLVDNREIAPPVTVDLLPQPVAALAPNSPDRLSPLGGTTVTLSLRGLDAASSGTLQMTVTTADAAGTGTVTRPCTDLELWDQGNGEKHVEARVPGSTFAGLATFVVDDAVAGRSTEVKAVYYEPHVAVALPRQGPTTGGTLVTLIGTALTPLVPPVAPGQPGVPAFDDLEIAMIKGEREVLLPQQALRRQESDFDRLVFTMPPSPDGRPGEVDIRLRATVAGPQGPVVVEASAEARFLFGNPQPVFGPRGAVLDSNPVAVAPIALEAASYADQAPDFGVLYAAGGVATLQLLMAEENGMFVRFGPPRRIGDPEVLADREPRDLVAADFDDDGVPDFAILSAGHAAAGGALHVLPGRRVPEPPLGEAVRIPIEGGMVRCRASDLNGDRIGDLVLLPGPEAAPGTRPRVLLATSSPGAPSFVLGPEVPVRRFAYDAMEVADVDGDGYVDVAVLNGSGPVAGTIAIDVAYGDGQGGFGPTAMLDRAVPNYVPDSGSPGVGLHLVRFGSLRSLAVVLAGLPGSSSLPHATTPPVVAVLHQPLPRQFLSTIDHVLGAGAEPLGTSLAADLDRSPVVDDDELVVAVRAEQALLPMAVLSYNGSSYSLVPLSVQPGGEPLRSITALRFGTAFPADPTREPPDARAVFVVHESLTDGFRERRLGTMLVFTEQLLTPDLGFTVTYPIRPSHPPPGGQPAPVHCAVGGNFAQRSISSGGTTRDLALAVPSLGGTGGEVLLYTNDGFGGFFSRQGAMVDDRLVTETLVRVPAPPGLKDSLAFFMWDGRVGVWQPNGVGIDQRPLFVENGDLRLLAPDPGLFSTAVGSGSRLQAADVDGDGLVDLVALLSFDLSPENRGEGDALLMVLRGKAGPLLPGEFPYELPADSSAATAVHGNATSFALGNFVPERHGEPRLLEMAVAVPVGTSPGSADGDHVRFYRLATGSVPGTHKWMRSSAAGGAQVLLAGNAPTLLAAEDFDTNGTIDLLVTAANDATVRLFLNSGQPATANGEVVLEAFTESFASRRPASPGRQTRLLLDDINSDGNVDVLLATESWTQPLSSAVAFYLSSGTGDLVGPTLVSGTRLGDRPAPMSIDLGDFNGDGVPDLLVGWATATPERNIGVLFAGSR